VTDAVIWHNPGCQTSRNVLGQLRSAGIEPRIVEYLKTPPSRDELVDVVRRMGVPLRGILRRRGTRYDELGLGDPKLDDTVLLDAIGQHPVLIERPIVITAKGVRLCRPPERVNEII